MKNYTSEEREAATRVSLTELATRLGYTPIRKGSYYSLKEMDSLMIKNDRTWCRYSRIISNVTDGRGGNQIDFMLEFGGCNTIPEAVHTILDMNNIQVFRTSDVVQKYCERKNMVLPEKTEGKFVHLYAYLCKTRMLSYDVINYFVRDLKILYESKEHHNLVFLGKDKNNEIKYATQRGTSDIYGRKFVGDVVGNDKSHGINIINKECPILKVFESSIDCMSYIDITGDYESNKLCLGGLYDMPLNTLLSEYNHISEIWLCLDNDIPARTAVNGTDKEEKDLQGNISIVHVPGLLEKYKNMGYSVVDAPAKDYGKDYNENLKYYKQYEPLSLACNRSNKIRR